MQTWIYVDREGKMPQLRHHKWQSLTHPYYIRYQNDSPVARHGPADVLCQDVTGTKIWDYAKSGFVPINGIREE